MRTRLRLFGLALALSCDRSDGGGQAATVTAQPPTSVPAPTSVPVPSSAPTPTAAPAKAEATPAAVAATPADALARVTTATKVITAASLRRAVETLAADSLGGRRTPSAGLDEAARFIAGEYKRLGLVSPQGATGHLQTFDCAGQSTGDSSNVVAILPGSDPVLAKQTVIVSAHYDHLGTTSDGPRNRGRDDPGDTVFNGANDDASGVAAMLGVAEALVALTPRPRRTVAFIGFCGEELGMLGSQHWAAAPLIPLADTIAVVNLEMLGRPDPTNKTRMWMTGKPRSTMGDTMAAAARELGIELVDGALVGRFEGTLFNKSDNWSFAEKRVIAHSLSTGALDDLYHSVDDEQAHLDFDAMAPIVRAIALGTFRLANDDAVPVWTLGPD